WSLFAGISEDTLLAALASVPEGVFGDALATVFGLLATPASDSLLALAKTRLSQATDPGAMLGRVPLRLRIALTEDPAKPGPFAEIKREESQFLAGKTPEQVRFADYSIQDGHTADSNGDGESNDMVARKAFFDVAYRGATAKASKGTGIFPMLL